MHDLPHGHAVHDADGHKITLMHDANQDGRWEIYEGAKYLGIVFETDSAVGNGYAMRLPGDEDIESDNDDAATWQAAASFLIDAAGS